MLTCTLTLPQEGQVNVGATFGDTPPNPRTLMGISVGPATLTFVEGGSATFTVTLDSDPGGGIDMEVRSRGTSCTVW